MRNTARLSLYKTFAQWSSRMKDSFLHVEYLELCAAKLPWDRPRKSTFIRQNFIPLLANRICHGDIPSPGALCLASIAEGLLSQTHHHHPEHLLTQAHHGERGELPLTCPSLKYMRWRGSTALGLTLVASPLLPRMWTTNSCPTLGEGSFSRAMRSMKG